MPHLTASKGEMNMKNRTLRQITAAGVIAAAYAAISLVLAPITFGAVQCRVSEALTLLPVLSPAAVWGVTLGCAITNGVGAATGANFLGMVDLFVGTAATLLAAITSRLLGKIRFGGIPWLSVLPPILFNAVAIGAEWCYAATGSINVAFWAFAGQIALGQLPPCLLGVWLIHLLERRGLQNIIEGK